MWSTTATKLWAAALATLVIGLAACGDGEGDKTTAQEAAKGSSQTDVPDLERFLMRKDEEPGFRPGAAPGAMPQSGGTITGVEAYVNDMRLTPADARRLRGEGFISYTFQPIRGPRTAGISNVALFETVEGAKRNLAHETRADVIRSFGPVADLRRFTVPGIPGARGWTASEPHVGNVYWVQGRCVLVLGNQGPGPFVGPLSKGARALYERTNGECPSEQEPGSAGGDAGVRWPAPPDPLERTVAAGLEPERKEFLIHHAHAHLDVFVDGEPIGVPAGIGINRDDPEVRRFDLPDGSVSYGGIKRCRKPCISPLHTHDETGILHTESATPEPNTLGQFFTEWGVRLNESCVGVYCRSECIVFYVNGKPYGRDPRAIELTDGKEIAIVIGTPPAEIPKTADFSNA